MADINLATRKESELAITEGERKGGGRPRSFVEGSEEEMAREGMVTEVQREGSPKGHRNDKRFGERSFVFASKPSHIN